MRCGGTAHWTDILVVLEALTPLERVVFVLHELFGFEHAEVARALERTEPAVRQLASRARKYVREHRPQALPDPTEHTRVTIKFMHAAVNGDVTALLAVLAPDLVGLTDGGGAPLPGGLTRPRPRASLTTSVTPTATSGPPPRAARARPLTRVLIIGSLSKASWFTASVSLYTGPIAQALGAGEVVLADARPEVRRQADALGLTALTPADAARQGPASLVVDVSGTPGGLRFALGLTGPDGTCSSSGSLHTTARIPTLLMYGRNITLRVGRAHARTLIPEVLDLMAAGRLHPERVTTTVAPLDNALAALDEQVRGARTKTVITV